MSLIKEHNNKKQQQQKQDSWLALSAHSLTCFIHPLKLIKLHTVEGRRSLLLCKRGEIDVV